MPSTSSVSVDTQYLIDTLAADPRVGDVRANTSGTTLHVRAEAGWLAAECRRTGASMAARSERQWRSAYEKTYAAPKGGGAAIGPNYAGWVSSYTRQPIEHDAMEGWRAECCARMLALPHDHVLEIGCGVGLIAERVAPHAQSYHGIDFSPAAIASLQAWLNERPELAHVTVVCQPAKAGMALPDRAFDLVIINSVIQCFSDPDAIEALLADLWGRLAPGGHVFVGDVRPHRLNKVFQGAVAVQRAGADAVVADVWADRDIAIRNQGEFTADPGFFHALAAKLGATIRVRIKDTPDQTEMSAYRYDVVLGTGASATAPQTETVSAAEMAGRLRRGDGRPAVALDVPRSRLARDLETVAAMSIAAPLTPVGDVLRDAVRPDAVFESDVLQQAAVEADITLEFTLPPNGGNGLCEAWIGTAPDLPRPDAAPLKTHRSSPVEMIVLRMLWLDLLDTLGDLPDLRVLINGSN